jgi:hypothetical protein
MLALTLAACTATTAEEPTTEAAVTVEKGETPELTRLTLSKHAAERLGIETASVAPDASSGTVVPYAAVFYDPQGKTWTYTSPSELVFVRAAITVASIDGDRAILTSGPPVGTSVVTVGVPELYGAETGVGGGH